MNNGEDEKFLGRWSRLKRDAIAQPAAAGRTDLPGTAGPVQRQEKDGTAESAAPQLPPVDELTIDSDFRAFFHPKVDEDVKRAALKKLFSDPHFNVMDGLDTYIDDYSKADPLPVEMLAQMRAAQKIFKWARNELEEGETAPTPTPLPVPAAAVTALDAPAPQQQIERPAVPQASTDNVADPLEQEVAVPHPLLSGSAKDIS